MAAFSWFRSAAPNKNQQSENSKEPFFKKGNDIAMEPENTTSQPSAFFSPATIQPKLTIGQPNDKYEQEADTMADKVVNQVHHTSATPGIQTKCAECEKEEQEEQVAMKKDAGASLRRKPIFESNDDTQEQGTADVQRKCSSCGGAMEDEVQMKSEGGAPSTPTNLSSQLSTQKGKGKPLPDSTKENMESSFGTSFDNVRIHADSQSVEMNQSIGAQAFTHGSDVYFNKGKYDPDSSGGKHLLAHELTHVVQQGGLNSNSLQKSSNPQKPSGAGNPLPQTTKGKLEDAYDTNLDQVRIHNDSSAHEFTEDRAAQAITLGNNIYLGKGQYEENSFADENIIAHEVAHTIQQRSTPAESINTPAQYQKLETQADKSAEKIQRMPLEQSDNLITDSPAIDPELDFAAQVMGVRDIHVMSISKQETVLKGYKMRLLEVAKLLGINNVENLSFLVRKNIFYRYESMGQEERMMLSLTRGAIEQNKDNIGVGLGVHLITKYKPDLLSIREYLDKRASESAEWIEDKLLEFWVDDDDEWAIINSLRYWAKIPKAGGGTYLDFVLDYLRNDSLHMDYFIRGSNSVTFLDQLFEEIEDSRWKPLTQLIDTYSEKYKGYRGLGGVSVFGSIPSAIMPSKVKGEINKIRLKLSGKKFVHMKESEIEKINEKYSEVRKKTLGIVDIPSLKISPAIGQAALPILLVPVAAALVGAVLGALDLIAIIGILLILLFALVVLIAEAIIPWIQDLSSPAIPIPHQEPQPFPVAPPIPFPGAPPLPIPDVDSPKPPAIDIVPIPKENKPSPRKDNPPEKELGPDIIPPLSPREKPDEPERKPRKGGRFLVKFKNFQDCEVTTIDEAKNKITFQRRFGTGVKTLPLDVVVNELTKPDGVSQVVRIIDVRWNYIPKYEDLASGYNRKIEMGRKFEPGFDPDKQKEMIRTRNKDLNGGRLKSDDPNDPYQDLAPPKKKEGGDTTPPNEAQVDHITPKSKKGYNSFSNAKILSRFWNNKKRDK